MGQPMPVDTWTKLVYFPGTFDFRVVFSDNLTWHTGSRIYSREGSYFQQEECEKVGVPPSSLGQAQQTAELKHCLPTALSELYQGGIGWL